MHYPLMLRLSCEENIPSWFTISFFGVAGVHISENEFRSLGYVGTPPPWYELEWTLLSEDVIRNLGPALTSYFLAMTRQRNILRARIAKDTGTHQLLYCPAHCRSAWRNLLINALCKLFPKNEWILTDKPLHREIRAQNAATRTICRNCFRSAMDEVAAMNLYGFERELFVTSERHAKETLVWASEER